MFPIWDTVIYCQWMSVQVVKILSFNTGQTWGLGLGGIYNLCVMSFYSSFENSVSASKPSNGSYESNLHEDAWNVFFLSCLCGLQELHPFSFQVRADISQWYQIYTYSITALFSGRMTEGKWHIVIWHESNGFEACLEDMTKDLAPSAGSKLIACMTKADLIIRSVWHFKSQKVKVFNT